MECITDFIGFLNSCTPYWVQWVTLIGIFFAYITIREHNSIRKTELINEIYYKFLDKKFYKFYDKILEKTMDWEKNEEDEQLLNESLTLFDKINFLRTQGLLDYKAWEYIACEIQEFASNEKVWSYISKFVLEYKNKGYPKDIIPFTGFPDLLKNIPKPYKIDFFYDYLNQHKKLIDECNPKYGKIRMILHMNICEIYDYLIRYHKHKI